MFFYCPTLSHRPCFSQQNALCSFLATSCVSIPLPISTKKFLVVSMITCRYSHSHICLALNDSLVLSCHPFWSPSTSSNSLPSHNTTHFMVTEAPDFQPSFRNQLGCKLEVTSMCSLNATAEQILSTNLPHPHPPSHLNLQVRTVKLPPNEMK